MVGDGANDALALATASVGIAAQGGMEASLQAADGYSSLPGISGVEATIGIARRTLAIIRLNLAFAVFYNLIGIALALSGNISPLLAAILMPVSALTVFLSTILGLRAGIFGPPRSEAGVDTRRGLDTLTPRKAAC
jgi:Cu2+-exporting ATPase